MISKPIVGFAGMTHLGIVSAVASATKGFDTVCYPKLPPLDTIFEKDLTELAQQHSVRLWSHDTVFQNMKLKDCDIVYISADMPLDDVTNPSPEPIRKLIDEVIPLLNDKATLVVMSQVPPGFTRQIPFPKERLFYQVETLIFGQSMERALHPDRIIVGCDGIWLQKRVFIEPRSYFDFVRAFSHNIHVMNYESAELAKIAINTLLIASLAATNVLAEVCEKVGADWQDIVPVLRADPRIGQHAYIQPGLGVGGGHIERDLHTLLKGCTTNDIIHGFLEESASLRLNWCWDRLSLKCGQRLAILGLAYKPNTNSTVNSPGAALFERCKTFLEIQSHDPVVLGTASTIMECIKGADALVITTPWPEYRQLKISDIHSRMSGRLIIDPYRVLDGKKAAEAGFEYHALGMPPLFPA